jgi:predicted permease
MSHLTHACALSVRVLARRPARALALTALLGVCIAFNAAVFAVVDGTLFKPLPFPGGERVVRLGLDSRKTGSPHPGPVSRRQVVDLQGVSSIEAVVAWGEGVFTGDRGADEGLRSTAVTPGFFEFVGTRPALGRTLRSEDNAAGSLVPVVLGFALWQARFAGDPSAVGRVVALGGRRCLVVGVAQPHFEFPDGTNVWSPIDLGDPTGADFLGLPVAMARLRPGATCADALAGERLHCEPADHTFSPRHAWTLVVVLLAAMMLMAMTWFQVACLELARTMARIREIGVKLSLGATRAALAMESLCQGAVMALGALALSGLVLPALLASLVALLPPELTLGQPIAADPRAFLFSVALALGVVAAFTIVPLQALVRVDTTHLLRGGSGGRQWRVTASWLIVVGQVALSTVLLYVAGLAVRSMSTLTRVDLGYHADGVVIVRLPSGHGDDGRVSVDAAQIADELRDRPGVAAVAGSVGRPFGGGVTTGSVGRPGDRQALHTRWVIVTPGYFRALGVPLLEGRDLAPSDTRLSELVVVLSRSMARRLGFSGWQEGRRVSLNGLPATVVGTVGDAVLTSPDDPNRDAVFVPAAQWVAPTYLIVRAAAGRQAQAAGEAAGVLRRVASPESYSIITLGDEITRATAGYRARMTLLLSLAAIGIALCTTGVFGAVTFACESRRRAIAIRLAIGASSRTVRAHLIKDVALRVLAGIGIGVWGGVAAGRLGNAVLFGISPFDGASVVVVVSAMAIACVAAAIVPVVRIGGVHPSEVLREE